MGREMDLGAKDGSGSIGKTKIIQERLIDAPEMHTLLEVILSFSCSWACCQLNHSHLRSMVASPLRKPPPVVTVQPNSI